MDQGEPSLRARNQEAIAVRAALFWLASEQRLEEVNFPLEVQVSWRFRSVFR